MKPLIKLDAVEVFIFSAIFAMLFLSAIVTLYRVQEERDHLREQLGACTRLKLDTCERWCLRPLLERP